MLHVHRAERADHLVAVLGSLLAHPPADPFRGELVAVPTRGMERWLSQRLAARLGAQSGRADGVCAGVSFPSPQTLVGEVLAAASGVDPRSDPWAPARAAWPLLEVVDEQRGVAWLQRLSAYLGGEEEADPLRRGDRRLSAVRTLAERYDRYALHRPEMICAWAAGSDSDGAGGALPADGRWQAELWRCLRERIGIPGPAERLAPACARVREDQVAVELPERLAVFGLTRLAAAHLEVLAAIAAQREVHLFLLHPSAASWAHVQRHLSDLGHGGAQPEAGRPAASLPRRLDPTAGLPRHPLLRSWGRDSREMQLVLRALSAGGSPDAEPPAADDAEPAPGTVLERIQADVRGDIAPAGSPLPEQADERPALEAGDTSIQVHACHGRARQVEVLRDAILHLLEEDPTLEPRDVIVMCPDIESFAPLIHARFGAAEDTAEEGSDRFDLRVRLADRSLRQTNPVLGVVAQLLELASGRFTASEVLDFADAEPVRRRFGFDDDDLGRIRQWVADGGVRWGLDPAHRERYKLGRVASGTWQSGMMRLSLGVAMAEEGARLFAGVLPLDDVESGAIELAGRFSELVERLRRAADALTGAQPIAGWSRALAEAAELLCATAPREAWQQAELGRLLDGLVSEAEEAGHGAGSLLSLREVRDLLAAGLAGRPTRANFRTGHLTICTLYPMRSVPHRVVCLLGLDDGAFPRKGAADGDDLMLHDPRIGEREPRNEDRQLLLDALMAATQRLIITYSANDERTNLPRPPAVPVGELMDVIEATVRCPEADGENGRARGQRTSALAGVVIRHPLQPFDVRNFEPGRLTGDGPWSFDSEARAGAAAAQQPRRPAPAFLPAPLTPPRRTVVALEDLIAFFQHPVRAFLRQRLGIRLTENDDEVEDTLSLDLDNLERWGIGQRLLDARLAGVSGRDACLAEIARGTLPPGQLGEPLLRELYPAVSAIIGRVDALTDEAGAAKADPLDVRLELEDGRLLSGTVPAAHGTLLLDTKFSRLGPKHRLAAWVRLLAATAADPQRPLWAASVGRREGHGEGVSVAELMPLGDEPAARGRRAQAVLAGLIDLYDRGLREPLPLFCATSAAYARAVRQGDDPIKAASAQWTKYRFGGEDLDPEHALVLGEARRLDDVLELAAAEDECGEGWELTESSRFGRLARRLWDPLLDAERITHYEEQPL